LGVKSWQVREAASTLKPLLASHTLVVPLQNGIDAPRELAEALGEGQVLGGACGIFAYLDGPGYIVHGGVEPYIQFATLDRTTNENVEILRRAFAGAKGVTVEVPEDIVASMWMKFLAVAPMGAMGAITRVPMGVLLSDPRTNELIEAAKREIWAVGQALGVNWPEDAVARVTAQHALTPPAATVSMQRDIMQGRPSELEAQVGVIVRLGEQLSVDTPVNRFLYDCLMPQERLAREATDLVG
jgi:2-dehydropantoate 2-reductase